MLSRIFIQTKDIMIISGMSDKKCREDYKTLQEILNKKPHQKITIKEYANYYGIAVDEIISALEKFESDKS